VSNFLVISVIGLAGGLAIGLQAPLASLIGQRSGVMESVFIIHAGGALGALLFIILNKGGTLGQWQTIPWYALCAGLLGIILISSQVLIIPKIGVAAAITLIIAGQLIMATCVDHFGILGIEARTLNWERLAGMGIVLLGVWLTIRS
jgi:bacterial/archaeal transporter family-2 protein